MRNAVLKDLRTQLGLTFREFADEVALSAPYVSDVEKGKRLLGRDSGLRIMGRFRPDLEDLGYTFEELMRGRRARRPASQGRRGARAARRR